MKRIWLKYAEKIDAMSPRERLMVFVATLTAMLYLIFILFISTPLQQQKVLHARIAQQNATIAAQKSEIAALEHSKAYPDAENRARRDAVKQQIFTIDATLKGMQQSLIPAHRMNAMLQDMLARHSRLQLVALRTEPTTPLVVRPGGMAAPGAGSAPAGTPDASVAGARNIVFKHGVELTLRGSYADLHDYLTRLEQSQWRMFWSRAALSAADYPQLSLTLTIYTLSLDKAWLQV